MFRRFMIATLVVALGPADVLFAGAPISRLVIFGDSLSDVGNVDDLTFGILPGSDYFDGRFSNGPLWIEYLASDLGVPTPDFSRNGGTNYATGGAETGNGYTSFIVPNMGRQVTDYFNDGGAPAPGDLFVLLGGANDFFNGEMSPLTVVSNLGARITSLAGAGADRFLILNLPPLGQTPGSVGTGEEALLDGLVDTFNTRYTDEIAALETGLGITIHRFDTHHMFGAVLADPAAFGLTNVDTAAYNESTGAVVPDPENYLFWDDKHPTTVGHGLLGDLVHSRMTCPADVTADGVIDVNDLVAVIVAFGDSGFALPEDIVASGVVDVDDLVAIIVGWGDCE